MSWLRIWSTRPRRCFSGLARYSTPARRHDVVSVPCNSNGSITLDIHHPMTTSTASPTILLHLPAGPTLNGISTTTDDSVAEPQLTTAHLPFTLVKINYRYGHDHTIPTPIHDVLAGFDWVRDNLLLRRAIGRTGRADRVGRIAVCGERLGGTLATMLALTECRRNEPGIIAAAVHNPIVDWVELDPPARKPSRSRASSAHGKGHKATVASDDTASEEIERRMYEQLRNLRNKLFSRSEHYFDPFASPILFFRAAGLEVPKPAPTNGVESWMDLEDVDFHRQQLALSAVSLSHGNDSVEGADTDKSTATPAVRRKTSRRFPSASMGLTLPSFYISSSSMEPFRGQAMELATRLTQSVSRQKVTSMKGFGSKVLTDEELDELQGDQEATEVDSVQYHVVEDRVEPADDPWRTAVSWLKNTLL